MARVNIDGRDYDLPDGRNLLHACLSERLDLPYFCWHPAMGSVGSCRLCAVLQYRDEADTRGRLQMACMMTVEDGLRIGIGTSDGEASRPAAFAADFRRQVIEWLMENSRRAASNGPAGCLRRPASRPASAAGTRTIRSGTR